MLLARHRQDGKRECKANRHNGQTDHRTSYAAQYRAGCVRCQALFVVERKFARLHKRHAFKRVPIRIAPVAARAVIPDALLRDVNGDFLRAAGRFRRCHEAYNSDFCGGRKRKNR